MKLPIIPHDKAMHIIYGLPAGFVGAAGATAFGLAGIGVVVAATAVSLALGVAKEIYDKKTQEGTTDKMDALVTGIGGLVVGLATLL